MPFTFKRLNLSDVMLVEAKSILDDRGYFKEIFKESNFIENGINTRFVQDNFSYSSKGVLRGLHYQKNPKAQAKLVTVLRGEIFDVVVDIRKDSPTYGKWIDEILVQMAGLKHNLDYTILRLTNVYGPEGDQYGPQKMIRNALEEKKIKILGILFMWMI